MTLTLAPAAPMFRREQSSSSDPRTPREARLWIDGVGCWLLWLPERLTIGGPQQIDSSRPSADLPLLADLQRTHAAIERIHENHRLQANGPAAVNGAPCNAETFLRSGDEITLGHDVRLRFDLPTPLSASARVTFLSGHRPAERIDGVVLLAETCLVGPGADQHIPCRDAAEPFVLFRKNGRLWCRSREQWTLDGAAVKGAAALEHGSRVETDSLGFRLELR